MANKTNFAVNKKDYYRIQRKVGEDASGNAITKSFYGKGKREAEEKYQKYMESLLASPNRNANQSLGAIAKFYTYEVLLHSKLAASTIELYERAYRDIVADARITTRMIREITSADLQRFMNELAAGKRDGKQIKISATGLRNTGKFLRKLYNYLVAEGYCMNLMSNVEIPELETRSTIGTIYIEDDLDEEKEILVFTEDEIQKIISTPNKKTFLFQLALGSGLRIGEILALKYSDFSDGAVRVNKQLNYHYEIQSDGSRRFVGVIKRPKSKSSIRTVPLPKNLQQALKRHTIRHKTEMLAKGYRTEFVFTTDTGLLLDKGNFRRAWIRHLKRAGVDYKKFHACRATYCTMLCKRGVPLEAASKLMGHSDINITAEFYRAVSTEEMSLAAEQINDLFAIVN